MRHRRESPYEFTNYIFMTPEPVIINDTLGPIITYTAVVFNVVIIIVLSTKQLRNPSSVVMQGLALSDALAAFFTYGLEPFLIDTYIRDSEGGTVIHYPECKIHNMKYICVDMFHLISVYMTTALAVQKAVAIRFPFWSFKKINKFMMLIVSIVIYLVSIALHIPRFLLANFRRGEYDIQECDVAAKSEHLLKYAFSTYSTITASLLLAASLIMIFASGYIIWSLLSKRNVNINESEALQNIRKRSSKLVAAVTIIFLVIELPRIILFGILQFFSKANTWSSQLIVEPSTQILVSFFEVFNVDLEHWPEILPRLKTFIEVTRLLIVLACLSNFVIYVFMSKTIRDAIHKNISCCFATCRRTEQPTNQLPISYTSSVR